MEQTKQDISALNNVYKNASMGIKATEMLIDKTEDVEFSKTLHKFLVDYTDVKDKAAEALAEYGQRPQSSALMEDGALWMGVQMNTLLDKTSSHMAEMLIQGSSMGMIDNTKTLNTHKNLSPKVEKLTRRLNEIEENNVEAMKRYLS
ncbi:MAG TPA: hypothetical protein GX499_06855 [Clostridiales bacterium]|nr:hypothetical protein [Clostridiales bacterium]